MNYYRQGLKSLRTERQLTQEDVYNDTGIHISRIETGRVNVSLSTLKAILDYYQTSLSQFFQNIQQ
ncbi:MAG: XRE family transcriptional regulator [Flavobacteriia bacterium]|nr:XRE family transcriptional regulator [Flavobacteriia bacterium]